MRRICGETPSKRHEITASINTKNGDRKTERYSSLRSTYYEQRGGMNAAQYKDYVLVLLFVKYVSDFAPHTTHNQAIR
jgi:type I restriction-modification system DNA methylase subunit